MNTSSMGELQRETGEWADETFPQSSVNSMLFHLEREVAELHNAIRADYSRHDIREEMADCALLLFHMAHRLGYSLADECRKKLDINKTRQWGQPDAEGVSEHIKEAQDR